MSTRRSDKATPQSGSRSSSPIYSRGEKLPSNHGCSLTNMLAIMYGLFSATAWPRGGSCNTVMRRNSAKAVRARSSALLAGAATADAPGCSAAEATSRANSRTASAAGGVRTAWRRIRSSRPLPPPPPPRAGGGDLYGSPSSRSAPLGSASYASQTRLNERRWDGLYTQRSSQQADPCLLYTSPSPRDQRGSGLPSWA